MAMYGGNGKFAVHLQCGINVLLACLYILFHITLLGCKCRFMEAESMHLLI
jgi:hypothetical protein